MILIDTHLKAEGGKKLGEKLFLSCNTIWRYSRKEASNCEKNPEMSGNLIAILEALFESFQ